MKLFYKRIDLTEFEYDNLIKCIDFDKLKEIEKEYEDFNAFKGFNIIDRATCRFPKK